MKQKTLYSIKIYETEKGRMTLICDPELIGKKFVENNKVLDIQKEFYGGILVEEDEVIEIIRNSEIMSFIGTKSVNIAIKEKIIHPDAVIKVKGIPHAMYINVL